MHACLPTHEWHEEDTDDDAGDERDSDACHVDLLYYNMYENIPHGIVDFCLCIAVELRYVHCTVRLSSLCNIVHIQAP